jgi:peptidoglycan/LPS O-acetylase OafA/YrhL
LSGYLITGVLLYERETTGGVDLLRFFVRRVARMWPLYFLVLGAGFAVSRVLSPSLFPLHALAAYAAFCGNWYTVAHAAGPEHGFLPNGFAALWSAAAQEQCYLVWAPLVAVAIRPRIVGAAAFALWLTTQAVVLILCARGAAVDTTLWADSFTQIQFFAAGAGIAVLLGHRIPKLSAPRRRALALAAFACFAIANSVFGAHVDTTATVARTYPGYLVLTAGAALLFFSVLGIVPGRAFAPAVAIGEMTFGLYVFHLPCIYLGHAFAGNVLHLTHLKSLFGFVPGLPLALALATLSYRYLEMPLIRRAARFRKRSTSRSHAHLVTVVNARS